jgi:hypothetical protein
MTLLVLRDGVVHRPGMLDKSKIFQSSGYRDAASQYGLLVERSQISAARGQLLLNCQPLQCAVAGGPVPHWGGKLETVILSLVFLLGVAAGYIGHNKISRVRHERAQIELS